MNFPSNVSVYFCVLPIDMRRSFDSLAEIVRDCLGHDPQSGHLFVFRNKLEDCVKVLYWDSDGYAIWYKRLERGTFKLPSPTGTSLQITSTDLTMLLNGFDLAQIKKQKRWTRSAVSV